MKQGKVSLKIYQLLLPLLVLLTPVLAFADEITPDNSITGDKAGLDGIINSAKNLLTFVAGTIALLMLVYGGVMYMLSSGDTGKAGKAKNIILFALIGVAVIVGAYFLMTLMQNLISSNV